MQADATEQAVFITDADGTIEYVNPAFERTTGYSADDAIGANPRLLKSDQQDESFYRELWETITAGEVWEAELTNRRKSGELYRTTQKIIPVTKPDGTITHFVTIEEDITDAQFIEQVLHVMDRVLRHNVRNSVTAISGYADLLETELDTEEHSAAVQTIRDHADKLSKLSNETRAIRELFHRRHAEHSLSVDAIKGFVEKRREMHPDAVFDLSIDVSEETVIQNGSLLQLAIDEALENAIVHNDRDEPRVEIRVTQVADGTELCVEIADNGPGLPDDQWNVLLAGEETPLAHMTGIGLWLIYWTITALGGTIDRAENEPRGTVLTYRVPLAVGGTTKGWNPG
jgi:PAS domain S-box-containing protein